MEQWLEEFGERLWLAFGMIGAALIGFAAAVVAARIVARAAQRAGSEAGSIFIRSCRGPLLLIAPLLGIQFSMSALVIDNESRIVVQRTLVLLVIASLAWLMIRIAGATQTIVQARYRMDVSDNLAARRINTQVSVLHKSSVVLIIILAAAAMLMTFPQLRQVGTSVLASAGLAGLVVGFAARPVLTNLISGVQLALTQPIRLDDVVIVENEWGRIEEILSTYVVMRLWDERRLIVPLSYFVEKPFQNWTRTRADILGTAIVHVDYSVPVRVVRGALHEILKQTPLWDGRVWALHVTDLTEKTMQLRALMSAADAGNSFHLRCFVRERLIEFLHREYPGSLPRLRSQLMRPALVNSADASNRIEAGQQ